MLLKIQGIGNQKINYKNAEDISFDSLETYLKIAKKAISKFSNGIYHGLSKKMLSDEDAISDVANAIMMADWRWDENYQNNKGTKKTRYSYRNQCAIWAIQSYATKYNKKLKKIKNVYSLNHNSDKEASSDAYNIIEDTRSSSPDDIAENGEKQKIIQSLIQNLINNDCLSERQKDYIKLYYFENLTFDKIGKKYGITREAVRQGLNKAIELIKGVI
jgi:hypothetical protein